MQTAKKLLKKAYEDKKDPYLAILELRNTPIPGVGLSPTQLLMGRRTRNIIPIKSTLLTPMTYNTKEVQSALEASQQIQKEYFDRSCKALKPLEPEDTISIWEHLGIGCTCRRIQSGGTKIIYCESQQS